MLKARLEARLNRIWYHGEQIPKWLEVLIPVYETAYGIHRWWQTRRAPPQLQHRCIIVVGNLTVGGSGKTPLLIRICALLKSAGLKVGVVSRGYGRQDRKQRLVSPAAKPELVGDEPLMIARRTGVPVVVGRDRPAAVATLFRRGVDVVVSDDGLQHHRLPRSIEFCVINTDSAFGNGLLLPAGPLREPLDRLKTVDHVVLNGGRNKLVEDTLAEMEKSTVAMDIHAGQVQALGGAQSWRLSQFRGCRVHAIAGIANPERFYNALRHAGMQVEEHTFPDHHTFGRSDFDGLDEELPVIMTEKDAVKCVGIAPRNSWYLRIEATLPNAWEAGFVRSVLGQIQGGKSL